MYGDEAATAGGDGGGCVPATRAVCGAGAATNDTPEGAAACEMAENCENVGVGPSPFPWLVVRLLLAA